MRWFTRIIAWRSRQRPAIRWLLVFALYGVALVTRMVLGRLYGGIPSLAFFPVLLVVSVVFGWREALVVLGLSVISGVYLFVPAGMYLVPVGWILVGSFTIAIIHAQETLARELAEANERKRVLFRELQHRVANTWQSVIGILDHARRTIDRDPDGAKRILDEGIRRILASADVHRRLNDPALFEQGLGSILREAVATIIDGDAVDLVFDIEEIRLSFDEISVITMLVIELANNAHKHVFERQRGRRFYVGLNATPDGRALLTVKDDGPAWSLLGSQPGEAQAGEIEPAQSEGGETQAADRTLGQTILQGLARQLGGTLSVTWEDGTDVRVAFPVQTDPRPAASGQQEPSLPLRGTA